MSKVFSFRLDIDNPRESQAMKVIDTWISQGYSLRHIITDALINHGDDRLNCKEINKAYYQLAQLVDYIKRDFHNSENLTSKVNLPKKFIDSMKKSAKKGLIN